jgi:trans-2,3-dihydro-3-hydroxyanthranilate isomerase
MGRLSLLSLTAEKQQGVVTATYVGGRCVPMMTGTIALN